MKAKYIDAEKLKERIDEKWKELADKNVKVGGGKWDAEISTYLSVLRLINSLQQEQSGVDLNKFTEKINNYKARYKYPESVSIKGAMAFMARMFYQYPNIARLWYENLPKATMDDNARKEE